MDGVSGAGVGGASIRMKSANASMSERTAVLGLEAGVEAGVKLSVSSGVALKRQPGVSSRSWGKSWFVIPISTLYASPANMMQGLVLCLPSEAGNCPVVCADVRIAAQVRVGVTGDAQPRLQGRVGLHVREDRRVRDCFDEPSAKDRRRNAENDVRISALAGQRVSGRQEVGLGDVATRGVTAAGDDEEVVHFAVVGSVRIPLKACFADGTILRDEPGHHVFCPIESGNRDHGVPRRAGSAGSRLRVARQALV